MVKKYWRIWEDQYRSLPSFLDRVSQNNAHGILLCPEEAACNPRKQNDYSYLEPYQNKGNFTFVFGAYNYNFYKNNTILYNLPNVSIKLWKDFFIYYSFKTANDLNYYPTSNIKCLFTCMNNKAHSHRTELMDMLAKNSLLKNNFYSWHKPKEAVGIEYKPKYFDNKKCLLDGEFTSLKQQYFPSQMYQSLINLVSESDIDIPFITEKTYNCLLFGKMFVIYGYPGIHNQLFSMGFRLPYNIIDYNSFDFIQDNTLRAGKIARELKRISITYKNLDQLHKEFLPLIGHNRNRMIEILHAQKDIPQEIFEHNYYVEFIQDIKCKLDLLD